LWSVEPEETALNRAKFLSAPPSIRNDPKNYVPRTRNVDNQIEEQTKYLTPQSAAAFRAAEAERQDQLAAERAELFEIVQHVLDCRAARLL
jgi:hypothetical protein